jgi:formate dehydrogenase subunit gamma
MIVNKKYIKRHKMGFVYFHWINAVSFFMLLLTALPLYADSFRFLYDTFGAATLQYAHRVFAVIFILNPIIGLVTAHDGIRRLVKEVVSFGRDDIVFNQKFPAELIGKEPEGIPPQSFYNGGEKMNILLQAVLWALLVISGAVLWFGDGVVSPVIRTWMIPLHSICAGFGFAAAIGHIYLAVGVNPDSCHGMLDGTVKASYAVKHHGKWVDELVAQSSLTEDEVKKAVEADESVEDASVQARPV